MYTGAANRPEMFDHNPNHHPSETFSLKTGQDVNVKMSRILPIRSRWQRF